eukprot:m.136566 g.136566  ORF g.136566 m.136566 type:complete len:1010 (+) comp16027_c0_seq1:50-3079(+)
MARRRRARNDDLIQALQSRRQRAEQLNQRKKFAYDKAIQLLQACKKPIRSVADMASMKLTKTILKELEDVLHGVADIEVLPPTERQLAKAQTKANPTVAYIPSHRSGAYAILRVLYEYTSRNGLAATLTKSRIIAKARAYCDSSFERQQGSWQTAWDGIKTLEKRSLVHREAHSRHSRGQQQDEFEITAEGVAIAQQMLGKGAGATTSTPRQGRFADLATTKSEPRATPAHHDSNDFVIPESTWTDPGARPLHVVRGRMVGGSATRTPSASARDMARQAALGRSASRSGPVPRRPSAAALDLAMPTPVAMADEEDAVLQRAYQESLATFKQEAARTPQNLPSEDDQLQAALIASMTDKIDRPARDYGTNGAAPHSLPALKLTRKRSLPSTQHAAIELDFDEPMTTAAPTQQRTANTTSSTVQIPRQSRTSSESNRLPYPRLSTPHPDPPKRTGVTLVVDTRERLQNAKYLHLYARCESKLSEVPPVAGVNCGADRAALALGDYQFAVRQGTEFGDDSTLDGLKILPCCVERKTINDLVQRSFGRDHQKQIRRMLQSDYIDLPCFLLEGGTADAHRMVAFGGGVHPIAGTVIQSEKDIMDMIADHLMDRPQLRVLLTSNDEHTASLMTAFARVYAEQLPWYDLRRASTLKEFSKSSRRLAQRLAGQKLPPLLQPCHFTNQPCRLRSLCDEAKSGNARVYSSKDGALRLISIAGKDLIELLQPAYTDEVLANLDELSLAEQALSKLDTLMQLGVGLPSQKVLVVHGLWTSITTMKRRAANAMGTAQDMSQPLRQFQQETLGFAVPLWLALLIIKKGWHVLTFKSEKSKNLFLTSLAENLANGSEVPRAAPVDTTRPPASHVSSTATSTSFKTGPHTSSTLVREDTIVLDSQPEEGNDYAIAPTSPPTHVCDLVSTDDESQDSQPIPTPTRLKPASRKRPQLDLDLSLDVDIDDDDDSVLPSIQLHPPAEKRNKPASMSREASINILWSCLACNQSNDDSAQECSRCTLVRT